MHILASSFVVALLLSASVIPAAALTGEQKCTAMKMKASGKRYAGEMNCYAKAVALPAVDALCLDKVRDKFSLAYAKADTLGPCAGVATEQASSVETCVNDAVEDLGGDTPPPPDDCDPVAQTGCDSGEKCTWVNVTDEIGTIDCVPNGTVATGGACTYGPNGDTTGYDNCVAGHICIGGTCQEVCTLTPDSCPANHACTAYAGTFGDTYGACDAGCDPVTQVRLSDGAANCGSTDGSRACYMQLDDATGTCSTVPPEVMNNPTNYQQDDQAFGPIGGGAYLNGCAPGYAPLLLASSGSPTVICNAYCRPQETSSAATAGAGGTAPYRCLDRGASTHECKYVWYFDDSPSSAQNSFGFCWTPENYVADWDQNGTDEAHPRCTSLPNTDTDGDTIPQHTEYGCSPYP